MSVVVKFRNQDYHALRRSLTRERQKFVDPEFPPQASSIAAGRAATDVEWRRPTELVSQPRLVVDGVRGSDVMSGERGNAWFVTASAALTTRADLLGCVMPDLAGQDYAEGQFHPGIFRFVFCRLGLLYEVAVDDLLPTRRGRLVYAQSCEADEFWSALLEKACAKLHGDYESLRQVRVVDALASFVRGIPEHWDMRELRAEMAIDSAETQAKLAKQFQAYLGKHSLLLFSLQPDNTSTRMGDWTKETLVYGRGYILTDVRRAPLKDGKTVVTLLKFQNAWFDLEWRGAWGDNSPEWASVTFEFKDEINYQAKTEGIFWMSIGDALKHFTDIDICVVTAVGSNSRPWFTYTFDGEWALSTTAAAAAATRSSNTRNSAGGSYEYAESYATNPQYLLTVPNGSGAQTVSFCLEQGDPDTASYSSPGGGGQLLPVGLDVFSVELNRRSRLKAPPRATWLLARVRPASQPSVLLRATFQPGLYVLMPCTMEPGQTQRYTVRSFSQSDYRLKLLPEEVPRPSGFCSCCYWQQKAVTRLVITKITGLSGYLKKRDVSVSVRVDCEASDVVNLQSRYYPADRQHQPQHQHEAEEEGESDTHTLNFKVLLYRQQLGNPVDIEVFSETPASLTKHFVGAAAIRDGGCDSETSKSTPLYRNGKAISVQLHCTVQLSGDLDYF